MKSNEYNNDFKQKVVDYYNQTKNITRCANTFNLGQSTIKRWVDPIYKIKHNEQSNKLKIVRYQKDPIYRKKHNQIANKYLKLWIGNLKQKGKYKEYLKQQNKHNYIKNKKNIKKYMEKWRFDNKEHLKEINRLYRIKNKEKIREYNRTHSFPNQQWRFTLEYEKWRSQILIKSNYICIKCGKTNCKLHAHHIKPAKLYPELKFDINNGNALCEICHKFIHTKHFTLII